MRGWMGLIKFTPWIGAEERKPSRAEIKTRNVGQAGGARSGRDGGRGWSWELRDARECEAAGSGEQGTLPNVSVWNIISFFEGGNLPKGPQKSQMNDMRSQSTGSLFPRSASESRLKWGLTHLFARVGALSLDLKGFVQPHAIRVLIPLTGNGNILRKSFSNTSREWQLFSREPRIYEVCLIKFSSRISRIFSMKFPDFWREILDTIDQQIFWSETNVYFCICFACGWKLLERTLLTHDRFSWWQQISWVFFGFYWQLLP